MMTDLVLVEGVSDVQLISYYLQNVYGWIHEENNKLGIRSFENTEHIENLSKNDNEVVLCGVGGNGRFRYFVEQHRINELIKEKDINSVVVVTDRDKESVAAINRRIRESLPGIDISKGSWKSTEFDSSFGGLSKTINTFLLIIPDGENGSLEKVIIDALEDIPQEKGLIEEIIEFIEKLKTGIVPELSPVNKSNKATVGTYFSIKYPQNAMRAFAIHISQIDWSRSDSLRKLFSPFMYLGEDKPTDT